MYQVLPTESHGFCAEMLSTGQISCNFFNELWVVDISLYRNYPTCSVYIYIIYMYTYIYIYDMLPKWINLYHKTSLFVLHSNSISNCVFIQFALWAKSQLSVTIVLAIYSRIKWNLNSYLAATNTKIFLKTAQLYFLSINLEYCQHLWVFFMQIMNTNL